MTYYTTSGTYIAPSGREVTVTYTHVIATEEETISVTTPQIKQERT